MERKYRAQPLTAEQILAFLESHAAALREMGVVRIGLFGSYARGDQRPGSDVDLLVTMTDPSYQRFMAVWHFLEDSLQVRVDLGEAHLLRDEIRDVLMKELRYAQGFAPISE